jgi:uncharacterized phage-associated protein
MPSPKSVFDVAAFILEKHGQITHMKLQKLVYYCQAWSLVWDESPLFTEKIEAWANGPVVPALFKKLKGKFGVKKSDLGAGNSRNLDAVQKETVERVIDFYGSKAPQWLSDLTHMENPWKDARVGLAPGERGSVEITPDKMAWYYGNLF